MFSQRIGWELHYVVSASLVLISLCLPLLAQSTVSKSHIVKQESDGPSIEGLSASSRASLSLAIDALEKDALENAESAARAAVRTAPRSAVTHNVLGVVLDRQGRPDEALVEFNTAVKLDPTFVGARNNIARLLAERGKKNEAIQEFERILSIRPSHVHAHYNLGVLYESVGDLGKSAQHFSQALSFSPEDLQIALGFINVAYRAERKAEAETIADRLEQTVGSHPRELFTLATVLAQNKQYERAARLLTRLNDLKPHTYEVLYNLGLALYNLERNEDAARYLAEAADLNPAPAETHFRLGLVASEMSDHANAVQEFKHAIERQSRDPTLHYLLGREYFRAGFWEGAVNEFSRAIQLDSTQFTYFLSRADAYFRKGEAAAAASDFDHAAELNPNIENIQYWQGYTHRVAGDFEGGRKLLEAFVSKNTDHLDALASLGFIAIEQGRLDEAEAWLSRALKIDPKNLVVLYDYARVSSKRRDYPEAAKRLEHVIGLSPGHTQAHYQLFLAYTRLKQPEKAQNELAAFKRLDALEKQTNQERMMDDKLRTQQMLGQSPR